MREIKFRAYDKHRKVMIYDYDQKVAEIYDMNIGERINQQVYLVGQLNNTLMQFTGLKDYTGKDIYEDDLVKNIETHEVGKVFFDCGCFLTTLENEEDASLFCQNPEEMLEVIGNIHENGDLLK